MNNWIENKNNELVIHIFELIKLLLRNLWFILIVTILCGALSFGYTRFMVTPLYEASIKMYVINRTDENGSTYITSSDILASQNLVETYAIILKSYPTLSQVIRQTGVDYSYEELGGMISTSAIDDTEIFQVTVTSADPEEAAKIANGIAAVAPDNITSIVVGSSVQIVETARVPGASVSPNVRRSAMVGAFGGFVLSCLAVILVSLFVNRKTLEEQIRSDLEQAVLAVIPDSDKKSKTAKLGDDMNFAAAESYKRLRTNLAFCFAGDEKCKVIGVTSSTKGEGKTTTAINLAYTLAQTGKRACLIDCDMRASGLSQTLGMKQTPGLSELLSGQVKGNDVVKKKMFGAASVFVITSGAVPPNPSEMLAAPQMSVTIETLKDSCDYLILDLPPVGVVSDPLNVSGIVDGFVFVVRENFFDRRVFMESLRMLKSVDGKVFGNIITYSSSIMDRHQRSGKLGGRKYGYGYGDEYGYGYGETKKVEKKKL